MDKTIRHLRVPPGKSLRLKRVDPAWVRCHELKDAEAEKKQARRMLQMNVEKLAGAQELLYASGNHGILIVLQGMDASGKDGTIKHVMSGINPQGCHVHSFKTPSEEELIHDFLWRYARAVPKRGQISIFNRSYYEEVVTVRIHPEWLDRQRLPQRLRKGDFWESRFEDINAIERHWCRSGIVILKFFLHISKDEQKRRLLERLTEKDKLWKFAPSDTAERSYWSEYQKAYEEAISATSTEWAPWYVIPADHKWSARALVADVISASIRGLKLNYPVPGPEALRKARELRRKLERD